MIEKAFEFEAFDPLLGLDAELVASHVRFPWSVRLLGGGGEIWAVQETRKVPASKPRDSARWRRSVNL